MTTLSIRSKRRVIAFCYHAGIVVTCLVLSDAGHALHSTTMSVLSALMLLGDVLTFRVLPISRHLQEALIPYAMCSGCGAVIDLVGMYKCSCGFVSHKEKHIFSPCTMCGRGYEWINCSECGASIPI